jgi:hypothetical protein
VVAAKPAPKPAPKAAPVPVKKPDSSSEDDKPKGGFFGLFGGSPNKLVHFDIRDLVVKLQSYG